MSESDARLPAPPGIVHQRRDISRAFTNGRDQFASCVITCNVTGNVLSGSALVWRHDIDIEHTVSTHCQTITDGRSDTG